MVPIIEEPYTGALVRKAFDLFGFGIGALGGVGFSCSCKYFSKVFALACCVQIGYAFLALHCDSGSVPILALAALWCLRGHGSA